MLVLSRRIGEKIVIGDKEIVLTVIQVERNKVRIGIEADRSIPIYRGELLEDKSSSHEESQ